MLKKRYFEKKYNFVSYNLFYSTLGSCTRQRLYGEKKLGTLYESDIYVEKFASLNTHTNRYTSDNNVYQRIANLYL